MKQQKVKVVIELPRIPENAWLFEKRFKSKPAENKKKENLEDKESISCYGSRRDNG